MKIRRSLLKDLVSVETYSGESAYGPVYADSVEVPCHVDVRRRLVRNAEGDEVVSEATLYVHPSDASPFVAESRVTIAGHEARVITAASQTMRGQPVQTEVTCT